MNNERVEPNVLSDRAPQAAVSHPVPHAAVPHYRDNILFLLGGILVGFVFAYLLFEAVSIRQPPRLTPQLRAQIVTEEGGAAEAGPTDARVSDTQGQAPAGGAGGSGQGGPAMAQIQQLKDAVDKNPNDADAVRKLADANFDIQNWQRAQELYSHYLELRPNDPDVMTDLGITYRGTGKFDQALDLFRKTQKLQPDHWQSLYNEVVVLAFDLKQMDQAKTVLSRLEQMQPDNPDVKKLADAVSRARTSRT